MSSHPKQADLEALIRALNAGGVEYIVVGGGAAVLHGAPLTTIDLDIVHRRTGGNIARLLAVLRDLDAVFRDPAGRRLKPDAEMLAGNGQLNLSAVPGPLDVLCVLHDGRGYDELFPHSEAMENGDLRVRVLDLPTLIDVKASTGRAKDRLAVAVLIALLDEKSRGH